jgi:spore coat polysaccharide biosynthesis protein SpsF
LKKKFNNIGIIIQARMGSTRLPAKIMLPVNGRPILGFQIDRLKKINIPLYIATTNKISDNTIEEFSRKNHLNFFRGDENNVLSRYFECASHFNLDVIIRVTSDCPLIDEELIKASVEEYINEGNLNLYYSNTIKRSFPRGFDFEIFSFELLSEAKKNAIDLIDLEHVTPFIWKNKGGKTELKQLVAKTDNSVFRLTLDTKEDFMLLKLLIEEHRANELKGEEIIRIMQNHPELAKINAHIEQKKT